MSQPKTEAPEQAKYRIVHPWWDGNRLWKPSPKRAGSDIVEVAPDKVPSVTWAPLNEPARVAHAKLVAEVEARNAAAAKIHEMKDPTYWLKRLSAEGKSPDNALEEVTASKALKAKEAELAELKAENEALRAKAETKADPPPAQGVAGGDTKASPKR